MFDIDLTSWQTIGLVLDYSIKIAAIGFVPEGRRPSSSTAWLLAILVLPYIGLPLFLLMGSPYINKRRHRIQVEATEIFDDTQAEEPDYPPGSITDPELESIVHLNRFLTSMPAVWGVDHGLYWKYDESIQAMADAVDKAEKFVHVEIYIMAWDKTTDVFFQALKRAVERGVTVKVLFDQVGSWKYPGYLKLGKRLDEIGVEWNLMLPLKPWRLRFRRPDLRNHRKMIIIDGNRGFMGSQNMIDSSYLKKANIKAGRHWIDAMIELSGPVVTSMNMVFAVDWYQESNNLIDVTDIIEDLESMSEPPKTSTIVQLVPSGPGYTTEPNLRMFNSLIHHAKQDLILCSPYFIPDESLMESVTSAAYRGVNVELYVSEQGDQFMVDHAQSSYYQALLEAGVRIFRYRKPAVLHTKFLLADPEDTGHAAAVMGSSNIDMRSFGLNYEVSLMIVKGKPITQLAELGRFYKENCIELTLEEWNKRGLGRRYIDNVMRLTSALQ